MKLQNLTIIFIIIILPIILLVSLYINTGLKTIRYQALYDTGLLTATQDAIQAFETNTQNNKYADNPEEKRSIIKSSVKMFETSLCNTCNISAYNTDEIEDYIPAMLFGMYDGFYLYAPSLNPNTGKYEHSLKNYVYYSEILDEENAIVIRYSLDSYVKVSGYFTYTDPITGVSKNGYESREGFLINANEVMFYYNLSGDITKIEYYGQEIDMSDEWAVNYFIDNWNFSYWFLNAVKIGEIEGREYLKISNENDPEDPNSAFVQHKNEIIRKKIENVLNSSITAYSERTWGQNYKMPELTEEDWERIYSDISLTTFFQGKRIGLTKYNGYCVLNSNNHYEFINPNLLYFSTDDNNNGEINSSNDYYHDIRCSVLEGLDSTGDAYGSIGNVKTEPGEVEGARKEITTLRGWKIGRFRKVKIERDESGNPTNTNTTSTTRTGPELKYQDYNKYMYERAECGCYLCINGSVNTNVSVYEYISVAKELEGTTDNDFLKSSYWTSLARERARLHVEEPEPDFEVKKEAEEPKKVINGGEITYKITLTNNAPMAENIRISDIVSSADRIESHRITEWQLSTSAVGGGYYTTTSEQAKVFTSEGCNVWLAEGQTLTIKYVAKITDLDHDNLVTNTVTAMVNRGGNIYTDTASVTCETVNSDLDVIKTLELDDVEIAHSKDNPVSDKVIEHGSTVKYIVKITNDAALTDKIRIEDWFDRNKITGVNKNRIKVSGASLSGDGGVEIDDIENEKHLIWKDIYIPSGETITIEFEAELKGELGSDIINTVKAESLYTGYTVGGDCSVECRTETKVKLASMSKTLENLNIILVVDSSWSEFDEIVTGQLPTVINNVLELCSDNYTGYTVAADGEIRDSDPNNKLWLVKFGASSSFLKINKNGEGKISITAADLLQITGGTDYYSALNAANQVVRDDVENLIIFVSDGAPTLLQFNGIDTGITLVDWACNLLLDAGSTIAGGWAEIAMSGKNEYKMRILLAQVLRLIGFDGWFSVGEEFAKATTWNGITDRLKPLKAKDNNKIYSVYCNGADDSTPEYGLRYVSSDMDINGNVIDNKYQDTATNLSELETILKDIITTNMMQKDYVDVTTNRGTIDIPAEYDMNTIEVIVTDKNDSNNIIARYTKTDTDVVSTSERKVYLNKMDVDIYNVSITINAEIN